MPISLSTDLGVASVASQSNEKPSQNKNLGNNYGYLHVHGSGKLIMFMYTMRE